MAAQRKLTLSPLDDRFAIAQLAPEDEPPDWAFGDGFASVTRTAEEISVICPESSLPAGVLHEGGWRCLGLTNDLDFSLSGVVASLAVPLAEAGVAILVVSTYDSDYLLVKEDGYERAVAALEEAGHRVVD